MIAHFRAGAAFGLIAGVAALVAAGGCATAGTGTTTQPAPAGSQTTPSTPSAAWQVKTKEHVDLWLHGYALLQEDTTLVPFFRRGYRDRLVTLKNQANAITQLDANRDELRRRLTTNPDLIGGQFLPLYFSSWEEMKQGIGIFLQADGNPQAARNNPPVASMIAFIAGSFPTSGDREWLRLFAQSLDDERNRFYHNYWVQEQRTHAGVLQVVDAQWRTNYLPKFRRFLNNTQQAGGDILLSLPLDGEGRTVSSGKSSNVITVTFPDRESDATDVVYVFVHEAAGAVAQTVVNDNTTPAEKRSGVAQRYASAGAVNGGLMILQRAAPDLADGYARYYLRSAGRPAPTGNASAALATAFPFPTAFRDALQRQLDVVLGGI